MEILRDPHLQNGLHDGETYFVEVSDFLVYMNY